MAYSQAYQNYTRLVPADLIRLELEAKEVPPSRRLRGRTYLSLIAFTRVERITLLFARVLVVTYPNENVKVNDRGAEPIIHLPLTASRSYDRSQNVAYGGGYYRDDYYRDGHGNNTRTPYASKKVTTLDPVSRPLRFGVGKYAIPLDLFVPESEFPSFTYANPKAGTSVIHSSSMRAHIVLNGGLYKTGTIPVWIPAIGSADNGTHLIDKDVEMAAPKKYVTRDDMIKAVLGDREDNVKKVEARLISRVNCRAANLKEETEIIPWTELEEKTGPKSEVLREFNNSNRSGLSKEWKKYWEVKDFKLDNPSTPTIITAEFSLEYYLQLRADDDEYETPVILVDLINGPDFKPPQITPEMHSRRTFTTL
ncbi:hypothetical protein ECG_04204 [Echinococcus granulosus]|uniref:Arrestin_C domain-containing protein n=1 Tax=Echinococcus granulosus TaxID=6210 RepID=A0A068WBP7_ECHGR|nr:hypothetical protein ECG_04204 [Echinococcus granulosus]CDS17517.1 hypothetical protein EgrG_001027500 [Echinococcus granulosus]